MLTCIACSKQQFASGGPPLHEPPEDEDVVDGVGGAIGGGAATPGTRHAIKALTAQVGSSPSRHSVCCCLALLRVDAFESRFRFLVWWRSGLELAPSNVLTLLMSLEHGNRCKVIEIELLESNVGLRVLGICHPLRISIEV